LAELAEAAQQRQSEPGPSIRILALARSDGAWWPAILRERGMEIFANEAFRMGASGAPLGLSDRRILYDTALKAFRALLQAQGLSGPETTTPLLAEDTFDRPLAIAIAAYLSARGVGSADSSKLFDDLLLDERRHWKGVLGIKDENATDEAAQLHNGPDSRARRLPPQPRHS